MTKQNKKDGKKAIAKIKGTGTIYEDNSFGFEPNANAGEPLYNETLAENKKGCVKSTEKSVVMRVLADRNAADVRSELIQNTLELCSKLQGATPTELQLPELTELVGSTNHTKVYLNGGKAVMVTEIAFDEPDPKVAGILTHATPDQLKYIKPFLEPDMVYQMEVAQVCALLRTCKKKQTDMELLIKKSNKKKQARK